jgi:hypothetical protein
MKACKAIFQVTAGVIPYQPMPEYTKRWGYDSREYEQDTHTPRDQPTIFSKRLQEAHDYAMGLSNPAYTNWVRVDWMWM